MDTIVGTNDRSSLSASGLNELIQYPACRDSPFYHHITIGIQSMPHVRGLSASAVPKLDGGFCNCTRDRTVVRRPNFHRASNLYGLKLHAHEHRRRLAFSQGTWLTSHGLFKSRIPWPDLSHPAASGMSLRASGANQQPPQEMHEALYDIVAVNEDM